MMRWALLLGVLVAGVALAEGPARPKVRPAPRVTNPEQARRGGRRPGSRPAAAPDAPPGQPRLGVAQRLMKAGNSAAAVAIYRKQLATHPDAPAAHVGLGRALAKTGACAEAMEHLVPYEDTVPFGVQAALAAAGCAGRLGLPEEALRYDLLGVDLEPENARVLANLVLDADTLGDTTRVAWGLERLDLVSGDRDAAWYPRAVLALRAGDIDTFDVVLAGWERERGQVGAIRLLRARSWLDLGDAVSASAVLRQVPLFRASPFARLLHGETSRRLGQLETARSALQVDDESPFDAAEADALRARVLTDAGEFEAAQALLAPADLSEPDVVASWWYLARARGDSEGTARWARAWDEVTRSPLRRLEDLVPAER